MYVVPVLAVIGRIDDGAQERNIFPTKHCSIKEKCNVPYLRLSVNCEEIRFWFSSQ
jgi:hypothetical protein